MLLIGAGIVLAAMGLAVWVGSHLQRKGLLRMVNSLTRTAGAPPVEDLREETLAGLPEPVARYLKWAISEPSRIRLVRLGGRPEMNAGSLHRYLAEAVWCSRP